MAGVQRETETVESAEEFEAWIAPYLERMALIASRLGSPVDRDDIVQDALVRAWRHRWKFDSSKGTLGGWLFAITANVARSHARKPWVAAFHLRGREEVKDLEQGLDLNSAIRRLSKRRRLAVDCYYAVGLTIAETAQVMGCSEGTVKSTLADARSALRVTLDDAKERSDHARS